MIIQSTWALSSLNSILVIFIFALILLTHLCNPTLDLVIASIFSCSVSCRHLTYNLLPFQFALSSMPTPTFFSSTLGLPTNASFHLYIFCLPHDTPLSFLFSTKFHGGKLIFAPWPIPLPIPFCHSHLQKNTILVKPNSLPIWTCTFLAKCGRRKTQNYISGFTWNS